MKNQYPITNQKTLRQAFKAEYKDVLDFKKIPDHTGTGKMYKATTRCAFVDYVDAMMRSGRISPELAQRSTLD